VVLLNSWNAMFVNMLIAGRKIKVLIILYLPVMAANLTVNFLGIPKYGYMICAVSSVLSEILAIIPLLILMWRWYHVSPDWVNAGKHLLISAAAAAAMTLVPGQNIIVRVVVFAAVWAVAGVVTKTLDIDRLKMLFSKMQTQ
jgi:O-antigen/teichoic acid export membrane protein